MAFESYIGPNNFVGKDGFHWWVGQIEKSDKRGVKDRDQNGKNSNRFHVRIVGHHLKSCEAIKTEDLPLAQTVAPTTQPYGYHSSTSTPLEAGDWVIGFFMDSDMAQQPFILGSIGSIANAESKENLPYPKLEGDEEDCRAFTNFAPEKINPYMTIARDEKTLTEATQGFVATTVQAGTSKYPTKQGPGGPSSIMHGPHQPGGNLNAAGYKCTTLSQAQCPAGRTASKLEIILSELFKIVSQSGGQIGSQLTSKVTGYAITGQQFVMGYVNKILAVISGGYAWVKGELYNLLQQGVQFLVNSLLSLITDKAKPKNAKPPYDPKNPRKLLDKIEKFLTDQLAKIGCTIESLYDRLLGFIMNTIFDAVNRIWSNAICAVDEFVANIIQKIQSFIEDAIQAILGPLLEILGAVGKVFDGIGAVISQIFDVLGISCSGLPKECKKPVQECGEGPKVKQGKGEDFLDRLLNDLNAPPSKDPLTGGIKYSPPSVCEESRDPQVPEVDIVIGGGDPMPEEVPNPDSGGETDGPQTGGGSTLDDETLTILIDPRSVTKRVGQNHTFEVVAATSKGSAISYQWQVYDAIRNPAIVLWDDIPEANQSTYTVEDIQLTQDQYTYRCLVSASNTNPSSLTSAAATISLFDNADVVDTSPRRFNDYSVTIRQSVSSINYTTFNAQSNRYDHVFDNSNLRQRAFGFDSNVEVLYIPSPRRIDYVVENPVYQISVFPKIVNAGQKFRVTLRTENINNNSAIPFYIFGPNLQFSDFEEGTFTGIFNVVDNYATFDFTVSKEISLVEDELVYAALYNGAAATEFVIRGTYKPVIPETIPLEPQPPTACPPIISSEGQVLSIQICKPGTRYITPPDVFIQSEGNGYGASAVAVLDDDGYVKEIKIVRAGRGYPPAPPSDNLNCVITGFTIVKGGFGYSSPPTVLVDGDPTVAEAIVSNGVLVDIRVKQRTKEFLDNPIVRIIASTTGLGAIAVANISCLDRERVNELADIVGPTPVGEYIDCP
jgi:hypothetical protein